MRMLLAQYTSPKKSSLGYCWNSKNPEIHDKQLGLIQPHIEKFFPGDGRGIAKTDLHGGFLFMQSSQDGIAFRFLDGGQDARGRSGKITMNCAFFNPTDLKGKTLAGIFDATFMTDLTEENRNTVAEFSARDYFNIVKPGDYVVNKDTKRMGADEIEKIYQICTMDTPPPMLIEIKSTVNEQYVNLFPINKVPDCVKPETKNNNQVNNTQEYLTHNIKSTEVEGNKSKMKLILIGLVIGFIIGILTVIVMQGPPKTGTVNNQNGENKTFKITTNDNNQIGELVIEMSDNKINKITVDFPDGITKKSQDKTVTTIKNNNRDQKSK